MFPEGGPAVSKQFKGCLVAIASGCMYGMMPLFILSVSKSGAATSAFCLTMRRLFGLLIMLPYLFTHYKSTPKTGRFALKTAGSSLIMSATAILLYTSYNFLPTGVAITIHYLYPVVALLIGVIFCREKVKPITVAAVALSLVGIFLLCDPGSIPEGAAPGFIIVVLSAITCGSHFVYLSKTGLSDTNPFVFSGTQCFFSLLITLAYTAIIGELHVEWSLSAVLSFLAIGVLDILAMATMSLAVRMVGSTLTSILATMEPIVCTIGSALLLHDVISPRAYIGSVLVLTAVVIIIALGRSKEAAA